MVFRYTFKDLSLLVRGPPFIRVEVLTHFVGHDFCVACGYMFILWSSKYSADKLKSLGDF